ncbi:MAG: glycosyltransferase family protein, partial [Acidimicrobiia bacterium]
SCDVRLVVRGRKPVRRSAGQHHVLWVISHPETLDDSECDESDLVLVASSRFAAYLRTRTTTPVAVFLQATDHRRFRALPPDPRHAHPVAVVAKTRDVLRPVVADALAAGLRPAIYGTGWQSFVDPALVVADYVANDELPVVYSSIGVLLNDHWSTMQSWGFVSNRLFDALACDTPVISDDLPEVSEIFGDAVPTYRDPAELRHHVDVVLGNPGAARARAAEGRRRILEAHTFDHRARSLLELLEQHQLLI